MIRKRRKQLVRFYLLGDIAAVAAAFLSTYWIRFYSGLAAAPKGIPSLRSYWIILPFLIFVHLLYFSLEESYKLKLRRNRLDDLFTVIINCLVTSFTILLLFSYLKSYRYVSFEVSHLFLGFYTVIGSIFIFCFRIIIFHIFSRRRLRKNGFSKILIAGDGELAHLTAENLRRYSHFGIEIVGFIGTAPAEGVIGGDEDLTRIVHAHGVTDLFIALPLKEYDRIMKLIETGNNLLLDIRLVPDLLQLASLKAGMEHIEGIPVINLGDIPLQGWRAALKRVVDILVSLVGLVLFSPIMGLLALWIKLDSRGQVFYRQTRIGLDGSVFPMIKFRSMIENAERETGPIWSPKNDGRITRSGRFLRRYSLDELPQLFNVLIGDMSLVGPRPERPELVEKFKSQIPRYMLRHRVKAGMTGWAQVHGLRGNTPLDQRIEFDIYYIQNWTFRLDLEILFRTIAKFQFIDRENSL